jgi:SPP1 gp7 family putative phage head morphogenesis protein
MTSYPGSRPNGGHIVYDGRKAVNLDLLAGDAGWTPLGDGNQPLSDDVRRYYEHVGLLYRCVHIRADSLSKVPWVITNDAGETLWAKDEMAPPKLQWLKRLPRLLHKSESALALCSQAYWHIERNRVTPTGLRWFAPIATAPWWDEKLGLTHFVRNVGTGTQDFPVEDICYLRYEHPLHETMRDVSPAEAAMRAAGVLYNVDEFVASFFKRGAIKATLLTVKGNPPKAEMDRIKNWWKRFFQGVANAFGAEVLNAEGITPVVVGEGIGELSNTDLTEEKRNDIAITLGVPLSMVFSDAANHATSQQDEQNFYNSTIIPDCKLMAEQADEEFLAAEGLHLVFKPETMDVFQTDENDKAQSVKVYVDAGFELSVAAEILGIELPDGMEYADLDKAKKEADAAATARAEAMANATATNTSGNGGQGNQPTADANPNDPALQSEQRRFKAWARKRPDADAADFHSRLLSEADKAMLLQEMGGGAGQDFFTLTGPITPDAYKSMVLQLDPNGDEAEQRIREGVERRFAHDLSDAFAEQLDTLLPADASDEQIRAAVHQVTESSGPVREALRRSLEQGSSLGATVALDTLERAGLSFDWTLAHTTASRWASQYSYELVSGINTTTSARLQTAVDDWFKERTTLPDLVKELEPTFGKRRAKLIAQTETTRAAHEGSQAGYEESGVVAETEWVTANDEKVCPVCGPLDGKRAPLRGTYEGNMTQPAHPGCRCFERPVIEEPK